MIEHLRGRDRKLEPLGWTGQDAEWIALVCLHSGIFTRSQFCDYFGVWRSGAQRFVQTLVDRRMAVEGEWPLLNGGGKTCRISSKPIYRALGVEDIRHRKKASNPVVMRRLLSLDFVLEHPGMNWLPAEPEKVEFFEKLGLPLRLIPRRIYYGAAGNQKRYFALKLPLAVDPETVTFAYVDPGHQTDTELRSWGAAHGPLWDALRKKGRQVRVIGIAVANATLDRAVRVLEAWAAAEPGTPDEGLTAKQEIKAIRRRDDPQRRELSSAIWRLWGSHEAGRQRCKVSPKPSSPKESRLTTIRHGGPCALRSEMRSDERGSKSVVFIATGGRMVFATRSEGGVWQNFRLKVWRSRFPSISLIPLWLSHVNRPARFRRGRKAGTRATPPKSGGACDPDSGTEWHTAIRPHGVALVLIYPCGKAQKQPRRSGAESTETDL